MWWFCVCLGVWFIGMLLLDWCVFVSIWCLWLWGLILKFYFVVVWVGKFCGVILYLGFLGLLLIILGGKLGVCMFSFVVFFSCLMMFGDNLWGLYWFWLLWKILFSKGEIFNGILVLLVMDWNSLIFLDIRFIVNEIFCDLFRIIWDFVLCINDVFDDILIVL